MRLPLWPVSAPISALFGAFGAGFRRFRRFSHAILAVSVLFGACRYGSRPGRLWKVGYLGILGYIDAWTYLHILRVQTL